ncbi:hypothetical protein ACFX1Q_046060 [Malus domestica]
MLTGGNSLSVFLNTINASIKRGGNRDYLEIEEAFIPELQKLSRLFRNQIGNKAACSEIKEATRPLVQRSKRHRSPNFKRPAFLNLSAPFTRNLSFPEITRNFVKDF